MALSEFSKAQGRTRAMQKRHPHAVAARYVGGKIKVVLSNGTEFAFPPELAEGLAGAAPEQLAKIKISPSGFGLHFPLLDADFDVPALAANVFGSKAWMAQQLGRSGGQARSTAKAEAARKNGQSGGRPRAERVLEPT